MAPCAGRILADHVVPAGCPIPRRSVCKTDLQIKPEPGNWRATSIYGVRLLAVTDKERSHGSAVVWSVGRSLTEMNHWRSCPGATRISAANSTLARRFTVASGRTATPPLCPTSPLASTVGRDLRESSARGSYFPTAGSIETAALRHGLAGAPRSACGPSDLRDFSRDRGWWIRRAFPDSFRLKAVGPARCSRRKLAPQHSRIEIDAAGTGAPATTFRTPPRVAEDRSGPTAGSKDARVAPPRNPDLENALSPCTHEARRGRSAFSALRCPSAPVSGAAWPGTVGTSRALVLAD
jgi:hypothetical protein